MAKNKKKPRSKVRTAPNKPPSEKTPVSPEGSSAARPPAGAQGRPARASEALRSRRSADEPDEDVRPVREGSHEPLTIVGVGASAGGLEAFTQLLQALPNDTGFAIVFVQHLAPKHDSILPHLLAGSAHIPVVQVTDGIELRANHVFIIPPNA